MSFDQTSCAGAAGAAGGALSAGFGASAVGAAGASGAAGVAAGGGGGASGAGAGAPPQAAKVQITAAQKDRRGVLMGRETYCGLSRPPTPNIRNALFPQRNNAGCPRGFSVRHRFGPLTALVCTRIVVEIRSLDALGKIPNPERLASHASGTPPARRFTSRARPKPSPR